MAMNHTVTINAGGEKCTLTVPDGTRAYDLLDSNDIKLSTPCSGKGTCGKCRIKVDGAASSPAENEKKLLGSEALSKGLRLACYTYIESDCEMTVEAGASEGMVIRHSFKEREVALDPYIQCLPVKLEKPILEDQTSDIERAEKALSGLVPGRAVSFSAHVLSVISRILRDSDFDVEFIMAGSEAISVRPAGSEAPVYGIAVDIGTTTVVAYLIDLSSGMRADIFSSLNPQRSYGADVISRINHLIENPGTLADIHGCISGWLNDAVRHFCGHKKIAPEDIYAMVLTGNTTMLHFAMNISPVNIAAAPFIPVTTKQHIFKAGALNIGIHPEAPVTVMPAVASYIGGDTVAAVLSSGMYEREEIALLIDLGTNGEIVLGNKDRLFACSAAAGPAFEGANIRNGVAGVKGAIDTVKIDASGHKIAFTTIGGASPIGICGSGILDAVAQMLDAGIIDETGRIDDETEGYDITDIDGMTALIIDKEADIAVTQKDIRELQNAKAAIAAGIRVLINQAVIKVEDISKVYLAGGFGSYISVDSALKIGLLPGLPREKVESTGNSAGAGAIECLKSQASMADSIMLHGRIQYIELSSRADFMDEYIECMMFE